MDSPLHARSQFERRFTSKHAQARLGSIQCESGSTERTSAMDSLHRAVPRRESSHESKLTVLLELDLGAGVLELLLNSSASAFATPSLRGFGRLRRGLGF